MDNNQIVVGTEECPLNTVASIIRQSQVIRKQWSAFATQLNVPSEQIERLRLDLILKTVSYAELVFQVLEIWKSNNGSNATLTKLLGVVEEDHGANDVGELLRLQYNLPCREADGNRSHLIEWKDLSFAFREKITKTFLQFTPNSNLQLELPKLTGAALVRLMRGKNPHVLFKGLGLPEELSYYVSTTILTRNIISRDIFDQKSSDIFLFIGEVNRFKLSVLAKDELTGGSEEQLEGAINVKFMILDQASHFERIGKMTNHPVHLLKREDDGKFRWIKSKGGMNNLREYISSEQDELEEDQFYKIWDSQSLPVIICGTPGIGKSVLLSQLGHRLVQLHSDRTVLFIELGELIKLAKSFGTEDKFKMIKLTLQEWAGEALSQSKLNLDEETILIELLLDGFDEVDSADRTLALETLQTIAKCFKCIRLWITSRPHLMSELENSLNILGYNIRPFDEENQIQFLSSFWSQKVQLDQEKVQLFAKQCLKSLKATMNSTDNDIAGIPLQCSLIGEVYENEAVEYAKLGNVTSTTLKIEIGTITNLYRKLVKIKFQKYEYTFGNAKLSKNDLMAIHSHLSLEVLFPKSHEILRLLKAGDVDVDIGEVMKGGILTSTRTEAVTFIHRTFAEYFVAWFIFDKLQQEGEWTPEVMDVFFRIMECSKFKNQTKFTHPAICYFLNSMIANLQGESLPNNFPSEFDHRQLALIKMIIWACLEGNFVQIFKLFEERGTFDKLSSSFFNVDLLLLAVRNSSVELVKSVLTHFEGHHKFDLEVKKATLREAVKNGRFSVLEFLIKVKQLKSIVESFEENMNLIYDCIVETMDSSEREITEKIQILQMLFGIRRSEKVEALKVSSSTRPLATRVHEKLYKELGRLRKMSRQNGMGRYNLPGLKK